MTHVAYHGDGKITKDGTSINCVNCNEPTGISGLHFKSGLRTLFVEESELVCEKCRVTYEEQQKKKKEREATRKTKQAEIEKLKTELEQMGDI